MDLTKLKAEHPDVYAAAVEIGRKEERDRVNAHLKLGTASGDMSTAAKAIEEGEPLTQSLMATYQAAAMNKNSVNERENENEDLEVPNTEPGASDFDKKIAVLMGGNDAGEGVWIDG